MRRKHRPPSYGDIVLSMAPGGYWRLGESSGSLADSAGAAVGTGTALTYGVNGLVGTDGDKAVSFNGTTSTIDLGTNSRYSYGDTASASAWILRGAIGANRAIVCRGTGSFFLRLNSAEELQLLRAQTSLIVTSTIPVPAGVSHVAFTKTGTAVKLYLNGADVTGTVTNDTMTNPNSENSFIGAELGVTAFNNGTIDEVAVWNRALSMAEIQTLYRGS